MAMVTSTDMSWQSWWAIWERNWAEMRYRFTIDLAFEGLGSMHSICLLPGNDWWGRLRRRRANQLRRILQHDELFKFLICLSLLQINDHRFNTLASFHSPPPSVFYIDWDLTWLWQKWRQISRWSWWRWSGLSCRSWSRCHLQSQGSLSRSQARGAGYRARPQCSHWAGARPPWPGEARGSRRWWGRGSGPGWRARPGRCSACRWGTWGRRWGRRSGREAQWGQLWGRDWWSVGHSCCSLIRS